MFLTELKRIRDVLGIQMHRAVLLQEMGAFLMAVPIAECTIVCRRRKDQQECLYICVYIESEKQSGRPCLSYTAVLRVPRGKWV